MTYYSIDLLTKEIKFVKSKLEDFEVETFLDGQVNDKHYSKESNPKITILEILVYKTQPEIKKSKIFTRFNFVTKLCLQE